MLKDFLFNELKDFDNFKYQLEEEKEYTYVIFSMVFGEDSQKELTFRVINDTLYIHSTSFGWKAVLKPTMNKYFWIELLNN